MVMAGLIIFEDDAMLSVGVGMGETDGVVDFQVVVAMRVDIESVGVCGGGTSAWSFFGGDGQRSLMYSGAFIVVADRVFGAGSAIAKVPYKVVIERLMSARKEMSSKAQSTTVS